MKTLIFTQEQARATKHEEGVFFRCSQCGENKPVQTSGGTGYGYNTKNEIVCYGCCGVNDLADMKTTGKITLYLDESANKGRYGSVTNWPGTLIFSIEYSKKSFHNFAGHNGRTDFWFTGPDGTHWHGYSIGKYNQIAHCKRIKN